MEKVFEFLNILTNNQYEYIGVVSNLIYDEITNNGAKKLSETLLNSKEMENFKSLKRFLVLI